MAPRRGGAGAHRWRLHLGTAAPGLGDGGDGARGRRRRDSGEAAPRLGGSAGARGRRRVWIPGWGTAAGIGARGGLDWNELDRTRFGARAGKKREEGKGRRGWSFVLYSLITAGW